VNCKLGGVNLKLQKSNNIFDETSVVVGIDVNHPGTGSNSPSVVGMVAVSGPDMGNVATRVKDVPPRRELVKETSQMLVECLQELEKKKMNFIKRVIVYRDGVGDGQIEQVKREEVNGFKAAFKILKNPNPELMVILVTKRHHFRMFQDGSLENPEPGTVIDGIGTYEGRTDFFLCSHLGMKGTSRPSYYQVLENEGKHPMESIQQLSYELCFLMARATKSCSLPAPVFYSHLAAYRTRGYVNDLRQIAKALEETKTMWFV